MQRSQSFGIFSRPTDSTTLARFDSFLLPRCNWRKVPDSSPAQPTQDTDNHNQQG
jgi:hypothetical protein